MAKSRRGEPRWAERDKWLSLEEVKILLEHVDKTAKPVQIALVHFILGTGFRIHEVSNAQRDSGSLPSSMRIGRRLGDLQIDETNPAKTLTIQNDNPVFTMT